ncbi:MAG: Mov34/MPN/PAD-1 family protein [Candidatus Micrarchaeota archaeon]|nr:Mov34/MPN/PAD-1 family protein [Candidatus Micrarchaeota archaeon]
MIFIQKRALLSALHGAKEMHPDEFIALFRGEDQPDGSILLTELIIPPLATGDEESSSFNPYFIPANSSEKASFHSHPDPGTAYPSDTDLHYFNREGGHHFIAAPPFRIQDTNCYDASGKKVAFKVV